MERAWSEALSVHRAACIGHVAHSRPRRCGAHGSAEPAEAHRSPRNVQLTTCNVQRATYNMQRATCNVQVKACNLQHATYSLQRARCNVQPAGRSEQGPRWQSAAADGGAPAQVNAEAVEALLACAGLILPGNLKRSAAALQRADGGAAPLRRPSLTIRWRKLLPGNFPPLRGTSRSGSACAHH